MRTELASIQRRHGNIVLSESAQVVFDWQAYGTLRPHVQIYQQGTMKLAAALGR